MFNVYLIWNLEYILKIFETSLFNITDYQYQFLEDEHFIIKITYTSKIPNLKINPLMVNHPRHTTNRCTALFFKESNELTNELIIDTRKTDYCDFVDYIKPIDLNTNDIIQRQQKYWALYQYFNKYVINFSIKESEDKYIISLTHGADVKITYDHRFNITKLNLRYIELIAYVKEYEIPQIENIENYF